MNNKRERTFFVLTGEETVTTHPWMMDAFLEAVRLEGYSPENVSFHAGFTLPGFTPFFQMDFVDGTEVLSATFDEDGSLQVRYCGELIE